MKGFLSLDVDVSKLEINQCEADIYYPSSSEISIFHGSHKCHNRTSKVITKFQILFSSTLVNCPFLNLFCIGTVFFKYYSAFTNNLYHILHGREEATNAFAEMDITPRTMVVNLTEP